MHATGFPLFSPSGVLASRRSTFLTELSWGVGLTDSRATCIGSILRHLTIVSLSLILLAPRCEAKHRPPARRNESRRCAAKGATRPATRPAQELNLLAMGDWGEGKPAQKIVAEAMARYVGRSDKKFTALLSAGDNFYVPLTGTDDPTWQTLFEQMYDPQRLDFPFYIALGNHDYDQGKYPSNWPTARASRVALEAARPLVSRRSSRRCAAGHGDYSRQRSRFSNRPGMGHAKHFSETGTGKAASAMDDMLFPPSSVQQWSCRTKWNSQPRLGGLIRKAEGGFLPVRPRAQPPALADSRRKYFVCFSRGRRRPHVHPIIHDNQGPFSRTIYGFVHFDFLPDQATVDYVDSSANIVHEFIRTKAGAIRITLTTPSDTAIAKPLEAPGALR